MDPYELRLKIFEHNRNNLKLISIFLLLLLIIILTINVFMYTKRGIQFDIHLLLYMIPYIFLFAMSVSSIYFSKIPLEKYKGNNLQVGQVQIRIITFLILFFSACITYVNHDNVLNQMIYPIILILCLALIILSSKDIFFIIIVNSGFFIGLKIFSNNIDQYDVQHTIFVIMLTFVGVFISSANYKSFKSFFIKQFEMKQEKEHIFKFVMELQKTNGQLEQLATLDPLTNLPNRLAYTRYIEHLYPLIRQRSIRLTTLMIDIDSFKQFNDHYGHIKGDSILKKIAYILQEVGRSNEVFIARWGGEEFVALLANATDEQVENLCQQVSKEIRDCHIPHEYSPVSNQITISIGAWSQWVHNETDIDIAMSMADTVLYEVKNNGRNHYMIKSQT